MKKLLRILYKTFRAVFITLLVVYIAGMWLIRSDSVQEKLIPQIEGILTKALKTKVEIGGFGLAFPLRAYVDRVIIYDHKDRPMISAAEIKTSLISIPLLKIISKSDRNKQLVFNKITLFKPEVNVFREKEDSTLNIGLFGELGSDEPSQGGSMELLFRDIRMKGGEVTFRDLTKPDDSIQHNGSINYADLKLNHLNAELGLDIKSGGQMHAETRSLNFQEEYSGLQLDQLVTFIDIYGSADDHSGSAICFGPTAMKAGETELFLTGMFDQDVHVSDTVNKTGLEVRLYNSDLDFGTLSKILPSGIPLKGVAHVDGFITGDFEELVADSLRIKYGSQTDLNLAMSLKNLNNPQRLSFEFGFKPGIIGFEDLDSLLVGTETGLQSSIAVLGTVKGNLNRLKSQELVIRTGRTELHVKASLSDYMSKDGPVMNLKFSNSVAHLRDVRAILAKQELPPWLDNLGLVKMDAKMIGGVRDFVVDGKFDSPRGRIISNLHLVTPPEKDLEYSGQVELVGLNVDAIKMLSSPLTQSLNFVGHVKGKGTDLATMNTEVSGEMVRTDLMGYFLEFLGTEKITLRHDSIFGAIELHDPEGDASLDLIVNLTDSSDHFDLFGDIEHVDLKAYNITQTPALLSSVVNIRIDGDSLENYTGRAKFFSLGLKRPDKMDSLVLHDLRLYSRENSIHSKNLEVKSSLFNFNFNSNLSFRRGDDLVRRMIKEGQIYLQNQDSTREAYYAAKDTSTTTDSLSFDFTSYEELNGLFDFFGIKAHMDPETRLTGSFISGDMEVVTMNIDFDSLSYGGIGTDSGTVDFALTKSSYGNELVAVGNLHLRNFYPSSNLKFEQLNYEAQFEEAHVFHFLSAMQPDLGNEFHITANTEFLKDSIISKLSPNDTRLIIKDDVWRVSQENRIVAYGSEYFVEKLKLEHETESILINGTISENEEDVLAVLIRQVGMETVNHIFEQELPVGGTISLLSAKIFQGLAKPQLQFVGRIDDFSYESMDSVTIDVQGGWSFQSPGIIGLTTDWTYKGLRALSATGYYDMKNDFMRFSSDKSSIPLVWATPFVTGILSELEGKLVVKDFSIRGKASAPRMRGNIAFEDTRFRVDYLGNKFALGSGSSIDFNNERIDLGKLVLQDTLGHSAALDGYAYLYAVDNIGLEINIPSMRNFLFMSTDENSGQPFYGNVVVTSLDTIKIRGSSRKIDVKAKVTTGPNTWLDIPISDYSSTTRLDFVEFYNNGVKTAEEKEELDLSGFKLDLTVEPRADAKVRIIFDEQAGDIIEAYGDGAINMIISDEGDFSMTGYYEVTDGQYRFTAQNIVNKEFAVEKGGRITWNGDAYDALLDLTAVYNVKADAADILGGSGSGGKIPVDIIMHMTGSLSKPVIDLQLRLDQLNSDDVAGLASYFRNIQYDEQELNRQVVSLLMFRRFAPKSSYYSGGGGGSGVTSSISELISNQVNYWLSQALDSNIGVELNTNDFDEVELALKASFFNDRVTVERNGTIVGNRTGSVSIGDISVLVKLLPAKPKEGSEEPATPVQGQGQLVLEIFNRENFTLTNVNSNTTGAGLFYKKDFDRLIELFQSKARQKEKELEEFGEETTP